jgi:YidC/Oxa1 family membrane protein insertase
MNFYREKKINPLASCLPLLLQLPVFISLFYMLRSDLKKHICGNQLVEYFNGHPKEALHYHVVGHVNNVAHLPNKFIEGTNCQTVAPHSAKFLFLPDITNKATGAALIVLIVLYVGSQLASTLVATATADPNQRRLMLLLPVVFVVILYRYPAGLLVYWITTNMWTIAQQLLIRRHMETSKQSASGEGPGDGGGGGSPNGKPDRPRSPSPKGEPALAGAGVGTGSRASSPPPRPPRKKKKRSGRRR